MKTISSENGYYEYVSSWHPYAKQWWITSFNYHRWNPDVRDLYVIGRIDFDRAKYYKGGTFDAKGIYRAFKQSMTSNAKYITDPATIIFDDHTYQVYIIWGDDAHAGVYTAGEKPQE